MQDECCETGIQGCDETLEKQQGDTEPALESSPMKLAEEVSILSKVTVCPLFPQP